MEEKVKESQKTYEKYAKEYAEHTSQKILQFQLNKFISLLKGKKVLDAGCGCGRDVGYFLDEGFSPVGIDICKGLISEAKKRVPKGKFKKMDMLKMKFKAKEFNGIWMMASFSDILKKDAPGFLKGCFKVLDEHGVIYIAVKEGGGEEIIHKERYGNLPRFYAFYKQVELEGLLKMAGFKVVHSMVADDDGTKWLEVFAEKV